MDKLQDTLAKRCDLEDENFQLKKSLNKTSEELISLKKAHAAEIQSLKRTTDDLQLSHEVELADREQSASKRAEEEEILWKRKISEKAQQIEKLQQQLGKYEREHQAELVKLRIEVMGCIFWFHERPPSMEDFAPVLTRCAMGIPDTRPRRTKYTTVREEGHRPTLVKQYDNKLLKIQKQNAKSQQMTQGSSASQDIFRKKLIAVREESEREKESLKRKITELESQLERQSFKAANPQQGDKRRRFNFMQKP